MNRTISNAVGAVAILVAAVISTAPVSAQNMQADSTAAVVAVARFHDALSSGDSVSAVSVIAGDALIIEGGSIQTRSDYLSHHLGADMKASKGSKGVRTVVRATVVGDIAYVVSRTVNPASGAEGSTGSEMAELMVLSRGTGGWSINSVHWSSRRIR